MSKVLSRGTEEQDEAGLGRRAGAEKLEMRPDPLRPGPEASARIWVLV